MVILINNFVYGYFKATIVAKNIFPKLAANDNH